MYTAMEFFLVIKSVINSNRSGKEIVSVMYGRDMIFVDSIQ